LQSAKILYAMTEQANLMRFGHMEITKSIVVRSVKCNIATKKTEKKEGNGVMNNGQKQGLLVNIGMARINLIWKNIMKDTKKKFKPTHKTAEQLLKENPLTGKLAREVAEIEARYEREHNKTKPKSKQITAKKLVKELCTQPEFSSKYKNDQYSILFRGNIISWVADRKNWVAVSTWEKGGKNFKTTRVITIQQMKDIIKQLRREHENKK